MLSTSSDILLLYVGYDLYVFFWLSNCNYIFLSEVIRFRLFWVVGILMSRILCNFLTYFFIEIN